MKTYPLLRIVSLSLAPVLASMLLTGCGKLSDEAKEIVGIYYNPEISQTEPVMELHKNATCLIRAIKPGVLTYSVEGKWNVENDSLLLTLDPATLKHDGDSTLIGNIPNHVARKVAGHNDFSLQLENDGVTYLYQRRAE